MTFVGSVGWILIDGVKSHASLNLCWWKYAWQLKNHINITNDSKKWHKGIHTLCDSNLHPMCVPTPDSVKPNKWPKKCPLRTARHLEINPLQIGANLQCKRHSLRHYFSHYQKSAAPWWKSWQKYPFQHYFCLGVAALPLILWLWLIKIGVPRGDHLPPKTCHASPWTRLKTAKTSLACCHDTSWSVSRIIEIFNRKNCYPHGSPWWFVVGNLVQRCTPRVPKVTDTDITWYNITG